MRRLADVTGPVPGRFWLPEDSSSVLAGQLDVTGRWPRVDVAGELTPALELIKIEDGTTHWGPAPMGDEDLVLHGRLEGTFGRTTVIGAATRKRTDMIGGVPQQVLEGRYALVGGHVDSSQALFDAARLRVHGLDEWARLPGLQLTLSEDVHVVNIRYEAPETIEIDLPRFGAKSGVEARWTIPMPDFTGARIGTSAWFLWRAPDGQTLDDLLAKFVDPLSTMLTLLYGDDCPALELHVHEPKHNRWLDVYAPALAADPNTTLARPLVTMPDLGLDALASWLQHYAELSPLPQLVAGAAYDTGRTVQNHLLELATAAEGLHRRLHDGERRLSREQVDRASENLTSPPFDGEVADALRQALSYLWEVSYPQRLKDLVEETAAVAPGVVGKANKWRRLVVDARNGFAHRLDRESTDDDLKALFTLAASLRWLLTARLLLTTGFAPERLAAAYESSEAYLNFLQMARRSLPSVYGVDGAAPGTSYTAS